jgi:membrane associated rhomboid family serine protease
MKKNLSEHKIFKIIYLHVLIVILMWGVWIIEYLINADFSIYGLKPRNVIGLRGILFSPFIHGDFDHLVSNTPAVLVLGVMMQYFYPSISEKTTLLILLFTGILVWIFARPFYHIGASGLVYGFAFFLFFSSVFRNDMRSLAISFFVILFYGSIVWGLLPYQNGISWETHLAGGIIGTVLAYIFRHKDLYQPTVLEDETTDNAGIPTYREYKNENL